MTGQLVYSTRGLWSRIRSPKLQHYTVSKRLIVRAREKYLRTAADHPKQLALQNNIPQLIVTRSRFRHKATELSSILSEKLSHHQIVNLFPSPPWLASSFCTNQVSSTIPGILDCDNAPALKSQKISYQVDYTIYTSSSVSAGARNGGGSSNYLHRLPYSTNHCKYHQNKGSSIHQLLRRRNYCHRSCFAMDLHKCKLSPDFLPHLHRQPITM